MASQPKTGDKVEIKHLGENIWHPAEIASAGSDGKLLKVSLRPGRSILHQGSAFSGLLTLEQKDDDTWIDAATGHEFTFMVLGSTK